MNKKNLLDEKNIKNWKSFFRMFKKEEKINGNNYFYLKIDIWEKLKN